MKQDPEVTPRAVDEVPPPDQNARQRLLQAAVDLFHRKGYAATSVSEIVSAAGVTKPVLYYYFRNKEGIYLELTNQGIARFTDILTRHQSATGSARDRISVLSHEILSFFREQLPMIRVMQSIIYGPPQGAPHVDFNRIHDVVRETFLRIVEEGISTGEFGGARAEDMAWAIIGVHQAWMETQLCHPDRALGEDDLDRVLEIVFKGMSCSNAAPRED